MSFVCKQLYSHLTRFSICCRPTMVMSLFNSERFSSNRRLSSSLPTIIHEVEGDLFTARRDTSLAHCVSSDMKMGAGIAIHFRSKFGRVDDLLSQNKTVGEVAVLKDSQRFIFYLVTKKRYFNKPTERTLQCSLLAMREECQKLGVTKLAMPRIGCGLDGLRWPSVFHLLTEVFENCGMEITIYSIPDMKRKSVTPNLNRSRENFRKFFEPNRPYSLPESTMHSKRKFHTDSAEEDFETPKRRKLMTGSPHKSKFVRGGDFDARSPPKKKSSANRSSETSLSLIHRKVDLGHDFLDAETLSSFSGDCPFQSSPMKRNMTVSSQDRKFTADGDFNARSPSKKKPSGFLSSETSFSVNLRETDLEYDTFDIETLNSFSRDCPFLSSPKKRNSLLSPQTNYNLDSRKYDTSMLPAIPFLCEKDQDESNKTQNPDFSLEGSVYSSKISKRHSKYSKKLDKHSTSVKEDRKVYYSSSDQEEELSKENSRYLRDHKRAKSVSSSPDREYKKVTTPPSSSSKKHKRRSSPKSHSEEKYKKERKLRSTSKSHSEEKVKRESRRSSFKSHREEKASKEKRRSSSKSRCEEKSKKKKRRSSSKSRSQVKVKEEKKRSSKYSSEEKLQQEEYRSYSTAIKQPLDSDSSESSQAKPQIVSERFPSFNKKRPSEDISDFSDESVEIKPITLNGIFQRDNSNRPPSKSYLDLPSDEEEAVYRRETKKGRLASPLKRSPLKHSRRREKPQEDSSMDSYSKGRLGEIARTPNKEDDSLYKKVKTTPDKPFRKPRNSDAGRMYSDKETSSVSVKQRLSLSR
ncbi:serine/arginine repetitive matrix protein 2-like [Thrips palmi]|uniref:Serine/arginine repetitive matrix protein 2-like n=1 Tax=Thrips palmi TaxID=161013 RepID=A0A6P8ZA65_THRPL|nr:serine/arginine repetitive matrix protein 2-like [Thrips palmi]